jgi:hypothetical protein
MAPGEEKMYNQYTNYGFHNLDEAENMGVEGINYGVDNW